MTCPKCNKELMVDDSGHCRWCRQVPGAVESKATTTNPKDLFGMKKLSFTKLPSTILFVSKALPPVAIAHAAHAMMDGARKYGPYNWRAKEVIASIYVDAAIRHVYLYEGGEVRAEDSGVHHLGHAMACCAILHDAMIHGKLVDDRPKGGKYESSMEVQPRLRMVVRALLQWFEGAAGNLVVVAFETIADCFLNDRIEDVIKDIHATLKGKGTTKDDPRLLH